jgi:hypothetical protein
MATASSSQTRNKLPETMVVYVYIVYRYLFNKSIITIGFPMVFLWFLHVASCFFLLTHITRTNSWQPWRRPGGNVRKPIGTLAALAVKSRVDDDLCVYMGTIR